MRRNNPLIAGLAAAASVMFCVPALADPDKDESGHGRGKDREHKEEYRDGNCKVERKWEKDGGYKEERKCDGPDKKRHGVDRRYDREDYRRGGRDDLQHGRDEYQQRPVVIQPSAAYVYPPWVVETEGRPHYRAGYEPAPVRGSVSRCNSDTVGQVLGGVTGAVLGNQVGGGSGRVLATVGGGVAGVLIGGEIGRRIDRSNQACIGQALEFAPSGRRVEWRSDMQGQYAVVPGQVVNRRGMQCRPYEAFVQTSAGWEKTVATACRRSDGVWVNATQ